MLDGNLRVDEKLRSVFFEMVKQKTLSQRTEALIFDRQDRFAIADIAARDGAGPTRLRRRHDTGIFQQEERPIEDGASTAPSARNK